MPSPFPGMDPFLEHPALFPGVHERMATYLSEALQRRLPEPYYADVGERVWVEVSRRYVEADVNVLRPVTAPPASEHSSGGVALAAAGTKPVIVEVPHDESREAFVQLFARSDSTERLVTTIEVLSPANKTPGAHGRDLYLRKQREVLESEVHLVEIDLLRAGTHSTAVPLDYALAKTGPFDYHVCVHRFDAWEQYFVYPIRLEQRLPEIEIPLLPDHGAVTIDLQAVFDRCYETGPYQRRVRYAEGNIVPPLDAERMAWATGVLRGKGLMPAASS